MLDPFSFEVLFAFKVFYSFFLILRQMSGHLVGFAKKCLGTSSAHSGRYVCVVLQIHTHVEMHPVVRVLQLNF